MSAAPAPSKALLNDVVAGAPQLKHVEPKENGALAQANMLNAIEGGAPKLKHVEPKENGALTQAKVLKAVEGKHELTHVETKGEGLTEAQKEAFKNKEKDVAE